MEEGEDGNPGHQLVSACKPDCRALKYRSIGFLTSDGGVNAEMLKADIAIQLGRFCLASSSYLTLHTSVDTLIIEVQLHYPNLLLSSGTSDKYLRWEA